MHKTQKLWRALLLFTLLLSAVGGSFALPHGIQPVKSAPQIRALNNLVISEVRFHGSGGPNDEFIEIFNPTDAEVDLNGWRIDANAGNRYTFTNNFLLQAGQHFLLAHTGFDDGIEADEIYFEAIGDSGGIALIDDLNQVIDQVGLSNANYYEGTPLTPLTENIDQSYDRISDSTIPCKDTEDNSTDFILRNPSDPQNSETFSPLLCSNPTATPTLTPTATATSTATPTKTPIGSQTVIINEVAWSGTSNSTRDDEWIELYNASSLPVDINGWHLYGDDNTLNKVGGPDITLKGTIPAGEYFLLEKTDDVTNVTANQVYATGDLSDSGERLYLKNSSGSVIDTVNLDGGFWPAGTNNVTTSPYPTYATMERVAGTSTWVTYNGTQPIAYDRNNGPIKGTPGRENWINSATITTITYDLPDPSLVNQEVTVSVSVVGGKTVPTGKVNITGASTNCSLTLLNGTGVCKVKFNSIGTKTLIAVYVPDTSSHAASSDTELHQVSTTTVRTPTAVPTALPPPPLLALNEFVPRPGHDWNNDGIVNVGDEYIEVLNHGVVNVNLSGYSLDDEVNIGSAPYRLPAVTLRPGERYVFYGSETLLLLGDGGDGVRLLKPNGQLADAYNYTVVERPDQSFCRLPDNGGADDWNQNCYPTPGLQNSLNQGETVTSNTPEQELYCPIADTLPDAFAEAECEPYGNNIWRPEFWDRTGWFGDQILPGIQMKWPVFAN